MCSGWHNGHTSSQEIMNAIPFKFPMGNSSSHKSCHNEPAVVICNVNNRTVAKNLASWVDLIRKRELWVVYVFIGVSHVLYIMHMIVCTFCHYHMVYYTSIYTCILCHIWMHYCTYVISHKIHWYAMLILKYDHHYNLSCQQQGIDSYCILNHCKLTHIL